MKPHATLSCLLSALLLLASSTAISAQRYNVEIIVFANGTGDDQGEIWTDSGDKSSSSGVYMDDRITRLSRDSHRLGAIHSSLAQAGHRVLLHRAWRQPAASTSSRGAYTVQGGRESNQPAVDGYIRLVRGRYLHLDMDLKLVEAGTQSSPGSFTLDSQMEQAQVIRLQEKRRIRPTELHYFDHPRFGVLARVTLHKVAVQGDQQTTEKESTAPDS